MSGSPGTSQAFTERDFYLQEFRGRTLGLGLDRQLPEAEQVAKVVSLLRAAGARAVAFAPLGAELPDELGPVFAEDEARLEAEVWRNLGRRGCAVVRVRDDRYLERCGTAVRRLGLFKWVVLAPEGGLSRDGRRASFVHLDELTEYLDRHGRADPRRELWRDVQAALRAGVAAVNVCSPAGLEDELLTYAGSGTLFTRERYVEVRSLGVDDFDAAHDLLIRGIAEGFLAPRSPSQVDDLLAAGFGAFVEDRHLAGIGSLLRRGSGDPAEIAGLYTLTRFLGEGIGAHLVRFARSEARALGVPGVFACTTSPRVGEFFSRQGFRPVDWSELPPAKWEGYDLERRASLRCYLSSGGSAI